MLKIMQSIYTSIHIKSRIDQSYRRFDSSVVFSSHIRVSVFVFLIVYHCRLGWMDNLPLQSFFSHKKLFLGLKYDDSRSDNKLIGS